jgi:hypothetical protein
MLKLCLSLVVAWILVLLMGPKVIPMLRKLHFGQTIYDLGPQAHKSKQGTPVMGGLMMAAAMVVVTLLLHAGSFQGKSDFGLALLAVSLLSMLVGFADDYIKAVKKRHEGLTPWQKIAGQVVVAVLFSYYCYRHPQVGSSIILPISGNEWDLGWVYVPLMSLLAIFMINSANLQDGLDGLMGSVTSVSMIGWGALCLVMYRLLPDAAAAQNHLTAERKRLQGLKKTLQSKLSEIPGIKFHGNPKTQLPSFISFSVAGIDAERIIFALEMDEIYLSTGAACAASKGVKSPSLKAIGLSDAEIAGSLRISMGKLNDEENIKLAGEKIYSAIVAEQERLKR